MENIFIFVYCKVLVFSTQPGEFPGVVPNTVLIDVSRALLRGIWRTFSISSLIKRCGYPLLIKCVVRASERVLKNLSVEQILLRRKAMLKGIDCLV